MKPVFLFGALLAFSTVASPAVGVRLLLGIADTKPTKWDGSVTARGGTIRSIEPWRFESDDEIRSGNQWRLSTRQIRLRASASQQEAPTIVANGVIVWLDGDSDGTELQVRTAQGNFSVRLVDIPFGKPAFLLSRRVMADRVPTATQLTSSPEEQDFPTAAVDRDGNVWVAYVEFRHNKDHNRLRSPLQQMPSDFSQYKAPTGGDQILVKKYSRGAWGEPIAITEPGGDLYRPAIAVDGQNRVWVFWSANQKNNFDLWVRSIENGTPKKAMQLTMEAGSDVNPAAATDSKGRVWVAWQGWRNGRASILSSMESDTGFSKAAPVSMSTANEWNPSVAADGSGRVTVAWDSYRNGNYDVYARTATDGKWGAEMPLAATARYEAYPSIAYDRGGTLWLAYEEGGERWGKDFGAYETSGVALYQGRAVRVRGVGKDGHLIELNADAGMALPGPPDRKAESDARQGTSVDWIKPSSTNSSERGDARAAKNIPGPRNSMPRLQCDSSGRLWLAVRSAHPIWWGQLGTVWSEHISSFDGSSWTGPIFVAHSDNLLDNRPALAAIGAGQLMVVGASDSRSQYQRIEGRLRGQASAAQATFDDPYNNDLYAHTLSLPPLSSPIAGKPGASLSASGPTSAEQEEKANATAMRAYRLKSAEGDLRIIRGEFHRHSEISGDGGNDGTLLEQWRYMLDPAAMDWVGCCDHDNGGGREYTWWLEQKLTDVFYTPGKFAAMFAYERSVTYPEGHRNVVFAQRGIRTLPRLPKQEEATPGPAPDTQMLYKYLKAFNGIVASHTSGTNMGTDWRDNDPIAEPVVEIYQGDRQNYEMPGAPRTNTDKDSIGGWRPKGFVDLALQKGYKMSFQASSDHISTHMSYCNILAKDATREALLDAFKKRHVYGATDDIIADFRCGAHIMGDAFSSATPPEFRVMLKGTGPFAKVSIVKDNKYVYTAQPNSAKVDFAWKDSSPQAGKTSYYYVRGEQKDGEIVWASPMWITYSPK